MSHEIRQYDVQEGRIQAWHGLTKVNENLSLENCWLNSWDYLPKPIVVDGMKTPFMLLGVTDECPVTDEETGEVSPLAIGRPYHRDSFKPILNKSLLEKLIKAVEGQGLTLESVGTVMNRARLFISFGLADARFQAAGREFHAFLNVLNGQDMSAPFCVNTSNICVVCNNTFNMNLDSAGFIMEVKKTKFSDLKIGNIGPAIKGMLKEQEAFAKTLTELHSIECDEKTAREFFAGFLAGSPDAPLSTRSENNMERLVQLFKGGAGNDGNDFSDVFSAITDYYTHEAASGEGDAAAAWKNYVSSEFGSGRSKKQQAWAILNTEKLRKGMITIGRKVLKLTADKAKAEAAK